MVASNELNSNFFVSIAKLLFDTILEIEKKLNISFEFVNLGNFTSPSFHFEIVELKFCIF